MEINSVLHTVGDNIRRLRGPMSQKDLAKKAGVSRSTVQIAESGRSVGFDNILKIAKALDIDPADLFLTDEDRKEISYKAKLVFERLEEYLKK